MSKKLVLAEKPSVGRDISRVLGCQNKNNGYYEGKDYIVTWALGHLVSLAPPEKYKQELSEWKLETLPMLPNPFKLEILKSTSKQYFQVKKLLDRQDVKEIIIATDAGREGELVARWILEYARSKKPTKRLWISSVTDKAIRNGFNNLVDGNKHKNLYFAARARAKADWIVGINGTRALTCKYNASLSMGRVQTPAVGLIARRDQDIKGFVSQTYYELLGEALSIKLKWYSKDNSQKITTKEFAEKLKKKLIGEATISNCHVKTKKVYAKGLYDLTELQRDANKAYGFSAKETLNTMQGLYEKHKVLTYPRTDSKYLTADIVDTLKERVRACRNSGEKDNVSYILRNGIKSHSSYVDNSKVGDHHAIIPTEQQPDYMSFSSKEQKIYNMVIKRFLGVLMPPKTVKEVSLEVLIGGEKLKGKAQFEELLSNKTGKSVAEFERIKVGNKVTFKGLKIDQLKTSPPKHLSEGDLLHEMEKVGLGTVATRSDIIEKIINNQYIDNTNNVLKLTKTGKQLLELVPSKIRTSELTAKWERDLEKISNGQLNEVAFLKEMTDFTKEIISEIKKSDKVFKHENISSESCPECGQKLLITKNKHGKRLVCPDRNCGYRKNLSKVTNARCPQCHKKLDLVGDGNKKTFVCKCGYKEKLEAFNKRKDNNNKQMSKREVQKFMNKSHKKEEAFNNPFASLLGDVERDTKK